MTFENLEQLRDAMIADDPAVLDRHGQWSSNLPNFGGVEPADTVEVWSWDEGRVLLGTCRDDLSINPREDK